MKRNRNLYPGTEEAEKERIRSSRVDYTDEPDIIHCASGYCPNYKKFEQMGYTDEQALILCNMD